MISGKKNVIKNVKIELAIGVDLVELSEINNKKSKIFFPKLKCGPVNVIKEQSNLTVALIPSKTGLTKGRLAKEIKLHFLKNSSLDQKKWINLLSLDEIILLLPSGNSLIKPIN